MHELFVTYLNLKKISTLRRGVQLRPSTPCNGFGSEDFLRKEGFSYKIVVQANIWDPGFEAVLFLNRRNNFRAATYARLKKKTIDLEPDDPEVEKPPGLNFAASVKMQG